MGNLKNAINDTDAKKNKLQTVATKIDNKLVAIGGEKAVNLADVPNKIQVALDKHWTRVAKVDQSFTILKEQGKPNTNPPAVGSRKYSFRFTYDQLKIGFAPKTLRATISMRYFDLNDTAGGSETSHTFEIEIPRTTRYIVYHNPDSYYKYQTGILNISMDQTGITFSLTHEFSTSGNTAYGFSRYSELTIGYITASSK